MALRSCLGLGPPPFYRWGLICRSWSPSTLTLAGATLNVQTWVGFEEAAGEGGQSLQMRPNL